MSKKHHAEPAAGGVNLGLIIIPMLDMSFQILSFFIMTYNPSAMEAHVPGSLVPPETVNKFNKNNPNPTPMDSQSVPEDLLNEELNEAIQIRIRAIAKGQPPENNRREGMPKELSIKVGSGAVNYESIAGSENDFDKNDLKALEARLKAEKTGDKANIKIEGDRDLKQDYVMKVYDVCKRAGFGKVNFVPPPALRSK